MPRTYVRKSLRATCYTPSSLLSAIEEIESKKLSIYAASKKYEIPISTLHDRVRKKTGLKSSTLGRSTAIPFQDEEKLASALKALEKWGFGLSREEVFDIVSEYVRLSKIKTPFKNHKPGPDWFIGFRKRHRLSIKKPQSVEYVRKKNTNPFLINDYFNLLDQTLTDMNLRDSPSKIWNLDETSVSLDPSKTKVVGGIGLPCSRTTYGSGKENITVLTAVNAEGKKLTPLIVFKGKYVWDQWIAENKEEYDFELSYAASKRGWMESQIFYNFIKDIFIPSIGEERPVLLIYDGHSTHVDVNVVELAMRNNVTILKLPPHTSHLLQPLDLAVFKALKTAWDAKLVKWQRGNVGHKLQKKEFAEMFSETWHNCSKQTIINGFRKGGIYPFNRNVIPADKYDPTTYKKWLEYHSSPKTLKTLCTNAINKLLEKDSSDQKSMIPENSKEILTKDKQLPKIQILSDIVIKPAQSVSFEEILLQKLQQSKRDNLKIKKTRITSGAEVITKTTASKILLEKKGKITPNKLRKNAIATKKTNENVKPNEAINNLVNSQLINTTSTNNPVPGSSGLINKKSKTRNEDEEFKENKWNSNKILTEKKANIMSTPKGKGIGKKSTFTISKENKTKITPDNEMFESMCSDDEIFSRREPKIRCLKLSKDTSSTTTVLGSISKDSDSDLLDCSDEISLIESEDEAENIKQQGLKHIKECDKLMQVKKEQTTKKEVISKFETMRVRQKKKTQKYNTSEECKETDTKRTESKNSKTVEETKQARDGYCVGDAVIVRYYKRKGWTYHVGFIEKTNLKGNEAYYTIRYLKFVKKPQPKFVLARQNDRDEITDMLLVKKVDLLRNPNNSKHFYLRDESDISVYFSNL